MDKYDLIADAALTPVPNPTAKIVLLSLASYCNSRGECFPSQQKLAEDTFLTDRTIRNAIRWLVEHGYLEVKARRNASNLYILTSMKEIDMDHEEKFSSEVDSNITKLDFTKKDIAKSYTTSAEKFAHPHDTPMFMAFWQTYPRRIGKGAARTAFKKAERLVDGGFIVDAAAKYARHCQTIGTEKQYIPHPSTWLNQERWDDDLESEQQPTEKNHDWINSL